VVLSETTRHNIPHTLSQVDLVPVNTRRVPTTLGRKRKAVQAYIQADEEGTPPSERAAKRRALLEKEGISHSTMAKWKTLVEKEDGKRQIQVQDKAKKKSSPNKITVQAIPKKKKQLPSPVRQQRAAGAGRPTTMTQEQEKQLDQWIEDRRRHEKHFRVTELDIQKHVKSKFGLQVGSHCVRGFMKRWKWSVRVRTTTKQVTGERAVEIKEKFQHLFAAMFATKHHSLIYNCDETSVYLDAPGNRTVERTGAEIVEIGTTKHELDRVMVMLFISRSGQLGPPLVVHPNRSTKVKPMQLITVEGKAGPFEMWVAYGGSGWLNGGRMAEWYTRVYHNHIVELGQVASSTLLFMDNCSSHVTEDCIAAAERLHLPWHTLPPHMTPLLQPLDQYVNSTLKREYGRCWEEWFEGPGGDRKTKNGNACKATTDEVNQWIASALQCITTQLGRSCWEHTMDAKPHPLRIPQRPYELIQAFLGSTSLSTGEPTRTWTWVGQRRAEATAQDYPFPDKVRAAGYVAYRSPWGRPEAEDVLRPIRAPSAPLLPSVSAFPLAPILASSPLRPEEVKEEKEGTGDESRRGKGRKRKRAGGAEEAREKKGRPRGGEERKEDPASSNDRQLFIACHTRLSALGHKYPVVPPTREGRIALLAQLAAGDTARQQSTSPP
jgi:hypothetical protein